MSELHAERCAILVRALLMVPHAVSFEWIVAQTRLPRTPLHNTLAALVSTRQLERVRMGDNKAKGAVWFYRVPDNSSLRHSPAGLWARLWALIFEVNDRDLRSEAPKLREVARLALSIAQMVEEER